MFCELLLTYFWCVHMRGTFPKPCYFIFLSFQKMVLINCLLFNFVWEIKLYATYSASWADCSQKKVLSDNIFGVMFS